MNDKYEKEDCVLFVAIGLFLVVFYFCNINPVFVSEEYLEEQIQALEKKLEKKETGDRDNCDDCASELQ